jgi:hypothetical protein
MESIYMKSFMDSDANTKIMLSMKVNFKMDS